MIIAQGQLDYKGGGGGGCIIHLLLQSSRSDSLFELTAPKSEKPGIKGSPGRRSQKNEMTFFLYTSLYVTTRFQRREFSDVVRVCATEQTEGSAKFLTSQVFQSSAFVPKQSAAFLSPHL